jgi:hypothetical protein
MKINCPNCHPTHFLSKPTFSAEKSSEKCRLIFKNLPEVRKQRPMGENSPNLVTPVEAKRKREIAR